MSQLRIGQLLRSRQNNTHYRVEAIGQPYHYEEWEYSAGRWQKQKRTVVLEAHQCLLQEVKANGVLRTYETAAVQQAIINGIMKIILQPY